MLIEAMLRDPPATGRVRRGTSAHRHCSGSRARRSTSRSSRSPRSSSRPPRAFRPRPSRWSSTSLADHIDRHGELRTGYVEAKRTHPRFSDRRAERRRRAELRLTRYGPRLRQRHAAAEVVPITVATPARLRPSHRAKRVARHRRSVVLRAGEDGAQARVSLDSLRLVRRGTISSSTRLPRCSRRDWTARWRIRGVPSPRPRWSRILAVSRIAAKWSNGACGTT